MQCSLILIRRQSMTNMERRVSSREAEEAQTSKDLVTSEVSQADLEEARE